MKNTFRLFKGVNFLSVIGCIALFALLSFSSGKVIGREAYRLPTVDAGEQASPSDQKYGDLAGTRTLSTITFSFINNAGGGFTVTLTDAVTGQDYTLHSVNGANAYYYNLPEGVYHIYMHPSETDWIYYEVGCNLPFEAKGEVWIDEVAINSNCNTIIAN